MNTQQKQEIQTALQATQQRLLHDPKAVPSKSYLATRAGISKSSVYNATKELAALGLIKITERFKKSVGQQTSNLYTILKSPPTVEKPIKRLRIERICSTQAVLRFTSHLLFFKSTYCKRWHLRDSSQLHCQTYRKVY